MLQADPNYPEGNRDARFVSRAENGEEKRAKRDALARHC